MPLKLLMYKRYVYLDRDLSDELMNCEWFITKIRNDRSYAQNVYAALCNMRWQPVDVMPILKDEYWSCTWRSAGGCVSEFLGEGDYLDWYCSGMGGLASYDADEGDEYMAKNKHVPEGTVTDEIQEDFARLGWQSSPWPKDD